MILSLLPTAVFAAGETGTYFKVTENQDDWSGEYLLVYEVSDSASYVFNSSLSKLDNANNYVEVSHESDSITTQRDYAVTVEAVEGGYVMRSASGSYLYAPSENNTIETSTNKSTAAQYPITFAVQTDGVDIALGSGPHMRFNANGDQMRFRYYKSTTYTGQQPVTLYKLDGESGGTVTPPDPEPETITIAEALAAADGTGNLTVKGVVTLIDGKNIYLQDDTGGICAYFDSAPSGISLGDTVIATGTRATYSGLPELSGATYETSSGLTLTPTVKTIEELTAADICTYVTLRNVEVTEVYDNNGAYSKPNITVKDSSGNTIQLYKAVVDGKNEDGTWPVKVGDVITITAAVGVYNNTTLQLRNTTASEIDLDGTPAGPIAHGDQVVIYNPAYGKALSADYSGYYNKGTAVTLIDGTLSGFSALDVWTVIDNGDGTWSFSYDGKNIGMDTKYTSMPLGGVNDKWELVDAGDGLYYVKNTVRNAYMEYQNGYGTWSAYDKIDSGSEGMFALAFYEVTDLPEPPSGEVEFPKEPFVIYNVSTGQYGHEGVLGGQDDNETSPSILDVAATVSNGVATPSNGARVFTVEKTEDGYYRFKTEHDGYLASNGTGSNAFYQPENEVDQNADWKVTAYNGGYTLMSRIAKYKGNDQYLEYYSGSYKTYSLYDSKPEDDKNIYTFHFYPVVKDVAVTEGVVNMPTVTFGTLPDAYVGQEYSVSFTVDSVFGVKDISAKYGGTAAQLTNDDGTYSFTIPGSAMVAGDLVITIAGTDNKDVAFTDTTTLAVKDEPYILEVFPAANAQTGDEKQPEIGFTFGNAGENPTITLKVGDQEVTPVVADGKATYTPAEAMTDGKVSVTATVTRADEKTVSRTWTFTIGTAQYQLYFGQLHSHTAEYSDGAGTLQEGLNYVANLPESANVDFVAFTDHSNYFDTSGAANPEAALYDASQMTAASAEKWNTYTDTIESFNAEHAGKLVALAGFEMTWSGGPGHINTFNRRRGHEGLLCPAEQREPGGLHQSVQPPRHHLRQLQRLRLL